MSIKILSTLMLLVTLVGCNKQSAMLSDRAAQSKSAELLSYSLDERYIYIDVVSHGCTLMTSFELRLVSARENTVEVIRKHPDLCRMKPIKMSLNYPFRHLGVDLSRPVLVVNQVNKDRIANL